MSHSVVYNKAPRWLQHGTSMASTQAELLPPPTTINNTHKVHSIAAWCIVLGFIASVCVFSRFGVRMYTRAFGADGYAMIPALVRTVVGA